jgi:hypothetical protein
MLDAREYFRLWLLSLEGVTSLVGDRVYCDPLPEGESLPAVSYACKGTPEAEGVPLQEMSATVWCWSGSEGGARQVYGALASALKVPGAETAQVDGEVLSGLGLEGQESTDQDPDRPGVWITQCMVTFAMGM